MATYDVIVLGGGHNGLTSAAYLAHAGRRVLVLEARETLGGLAGADEFHPGYKSAGLHHDSTGLRPAIIRELGLERHGLKLRGARPDVVALGAEGDSLMLSGDRQKAAQTIGERNKKDGEQWLAWHVWLDSVRPVIAGVLDSQPVDVVDLESNGLFGLMMKAFQVRRMGGDAMMALLRVPPMCVADHVAEWFEDALLQAALCMPAVAGTWTGPWSPGNAAHLLIYEAMAGPGVVGDGPAVIAALEKAAKAHGAEIRTGAVVEEVRIEDGKVLGVRLDGGESIDAPVVASSIDPKQLLLDRIPIGAITLRTEERVEAFRTRGTTAEVLLALSRPPAFGGHEKVAFFRTGGHVDDLERAFDAVKYREASKRPVLEVHVPTVEDASLAPEGHAVVSVRVHFAPHAFDAGWDETTAGALGDTVVDLLAAWDPGLKDAIVHREVRTPVDLERIHRLTGGHIHHGEHSLDQLLIRPVPECSQYATPVEGLFLGGSGSFPGGGLTGAPGRLAAQAILAG